MTGSPRQAARALGRHMFGAYQMRTAKGGKTFAEAWDAALELYRERELFRIKDNLADLAEQQEQRDEGGLIESHLRALPPRNSPSPLRGGGRDPLGRAEWEGEGTGHELDGEGPGEDSILGSPDLDRIMTNYFLKLQSERRSRLAGDIVAADFYLRQLTWIEVCMDIACAGGAVRAFMDLRLKSADGHWDIHPIQIAETAVSRYLD